MDAATVPPALAAQLGPKATLGLVEVLSEAKNECVEHVMTQSVERFERRLVEEISKVRIEIVQGNAALRQETAALGHGLRREMAAHRVEFLKWSFIFWIGQVVAVAGVVSALLRAAGR